MVASENRMASPSSGLLRLVKTFFTTSEKSVQTYVHDAPEIRFEATLAPYPRGIAYLTLLANGNKTGYGIYPALYHYRAQRKVFVVYGQSNARSKVTWEPIVGKSGPPRRIDQYFTPSELIEIRQSPYNYLDNFTRAAFDLKDSPPDEATIAAIASALSHVIDEYASLYGLVASANLRKAVELTDEQRSIVESTEAFVRINAFAGSGKTSTLAAYAKERPSRKILYLAFNRAIREEATMKFPPNVDAKTAHALAYGAIGHQYRLRQKDYRPSETCAILSIPDLFLAQLINDFYKYFLNSAAEGLDERLFADFAAQSVAARREDVDPSQVVALAAQLFEMMQACQVEATHDFILKMFQLRRPDLPYDVILFDEAQDASPVMLDIVLSAAAGKVFVGDRHQQIYSFRYAVNSLDRLDTAKEYYLTNSFRLGKSLADHASRLLLTFKGEKKAISGLNRKGEDRVGPVDRSKPYTFISRTNGSLFAMAAANRKEKRLSCVKEFEAIFRDLLNVYCLATGQKQRINNPFIAQFADYRALRGFAEEVDDKELKSLCKIVEGYRNDFLSVYEEIRMNVTGNNAETADILLTTTHTAKGLEFEQVVLGDDFIDLKRIMPKMKNDEKVMEEVNILYVAMTRAWSVLEMPERMREFFNHII